MSIVNEDTVEQATLEWLSGIGFESKQGSAIATDGLVSEREPFQEVVLVERLWSSLARLNSKLPVEAREEPLRKVLRPDLPTLIQNNRFFHQRLRESVEIEYRREDGSIAGDHAKLLDDNASANDLMALNQFVVTEYRLTFAESTGRVAP